jgi:hypothetical protein
VNILTAYPNVSKIFLAGDLQYGQQTLHRLEAAATWSDSNELDYLSYKLGLPTAPIRAAAERISGNTVRVDSAHQVLESLAEVFVTSWLLETRPRDADVLAPPRLRRSLSMDSMLLGLEGGCRLETAFEAFPLALDVARNAAIQPLGLDDSHRQFRELIDYRIVLNTPATDPIPRFYLRERDSIESYFEKQFLNDGGLFRDELARADQLERVLQHVVDTLRQKGQTTRRALLVVPHTPQEGRDLSPLGLVSIRIIPHPAAGRTVLDYSFSWRTVEAIVGLPYSLYGSIRYAQYLTQLIAERMPAADRYRLRLGTLSYIAHSLHIFLDEYTQNVARRIINDES